MQRNRFARSFHAPTAWRYAILLAVAICIAIAAMSAAVAATGAGVGGIHWGLDGTHSKPATNAAGEALIEESAHLRG